MSAKKLRRRQTIDDALEELNLDAWTVSPQKLFTNLLSSRKNQIEEEMQPRVECWVSCREGQRIQIDDIMKEIDDLLSDNNENDLLNDFASMDVCKMTPQKADLEFLNEVTTPFQENYLNIENSYTILSKNVSSPHQKPRKLEQSDEKTNSKQLQISDKKKDLRSSSVGQRHFASRQLNFN